MEGKFSPAGEGYRDAGGEAGGAPFGLDLVHLAELGDGGGLAGAARAGHDQPAAAELLAAVVDDQLGAGRGDLPDVGRGDQHHPAVVLLPALVLDLPLSAA